MQSTANFFFKFGNYKRNQSKESRISQCLVSRLLLETQKCHMIQTTWLSLNSRTSDSWTFPESNRLHHRKGGFLKLFLIKILIYSCYSVWIFENVFRQKRSKWIRTDFAIWKIRRFSTFLAHWKFSSFDPVINDVRKYGELEDNTW